MNPTHTFSDPNLTLQCSTDEKMLAASFPSGRERAIVTAEVNDITGGSIFTAGDVDLEVAASPRNTVRVARDRRPILLVDRVSPNTAWGDLQLLSVVNDSMYAVGMDRTIRSSSDSGATWSKLAQAGAGQYAKYGMFLRTATPGTLITTWHPEGGGAPTIRRSTNYGATFADVVAPQSNVEYLGPTSVCQDPVTGFLYLGEYVTVSSATNPTFKIQKSTDDGATWSTFHTFQRDAAANPTTAVRHCHGVQWDQHGSRIYFLTGDNEDASGIYRVNAAGTGVEPVFIKSSQTDVPMSATAVGLMFFQNYIAWGQDATGDAWLVRLKRDQIGTQNPTLDKIMHLQSTAWYTVRANAAGTEWIMGVATQPIADVLPLDQVAHLYRVADDGATCDEVAAIPSTSLTQTIYFWPLGNPLQANSDGFVWIGSNVYNAFESVAATAPHIGQQFKVGLGWGIQPLIRPDVVRRPWVSHPQTQSSGKVTVPISGTVTFGHTRVPANARRLFVFDIGVYRQWPTTGVVKVRVYNATAGADVLNGVDGLAIQTTSGTILHYGVENNEAAPNVFVSVQLPIGNVIYFEIVETGGLAVADATAFIQFAWGY